MVDIFLSYNRADQVIARQYADAFEASDLSVWWDSNLRSGEAYDEVTEAALREAKAVVVLWSPQSVVSRWVRAEATLADRNKTLVPVMVEMCERPIMFELTQTADLAHWDGSAKDQGWLGFLDDVRRFIVGERSIETGAKEKGTNPGPLYLPNKPSIAVLPFNNVGGDPDQAYFVDGLMEEVTAALTLIRSLFVISSGSSLSLKGEDLPPVEAARRLGVRYALEGSVRRSGNRVRIAVKLIDAFDGSHIWAEKYDDTLEDVFALQDKVALGVAGVTEFSIQKAETLRLSSRPTSDLRSYDLYLRALGPFRTYTRDGIYDALKLLTLATDLDSEYALALSVMAACHALIMRFQWSDDPASHGTQLLELVDRSLKSGPDDPQVVASAALAYWVAGDLPLARKLADRAVDLNPGSSFPLLTCGQLCAVVGDLELAEDCIQRSMKLDPFSPNRALQLAALAQTRFAQREFAEAADLSVEWTHTNKSPLSVALLASARGHLGEHAMAKDALDQLRDLTTLSMEGLAAMFYKKQEHLDLFHEGISLAKGSSAAEG